MPSYAYTNGDGLAVLSASTPDGASEPVSVLDDAVKQIKAYLLDPTAGPKALIDSLTTALTPTGTVRTTAVSTIPSGWLDCDGAAVSRTTYAALFAAVGVTYGAGDASTTFNVPNLKGRVAVGVGTGTAADATAWSMGTARGTEGHTLVIGEIPAHTHFLVANEVSTADAVGYATADQQLTKGATHPGANDEYRYHLPGTSTTATLGLSSSAGSSTTHNNVQPSLGLRMIIKT